MGSFNNHIENCMILAERFRQINADQIILTIKSIGIKLITIFSKTKSSKTFGSSELAIRPPLL